MQEAPPTQNRAERARQRRTEIVKVARDMFLALPYSQVSVETIAAMVGVSKVTIYSYFASKLDIYCAILTHDAQVLLDSFEAAADPAQPLERNVARLSDAYAEFMAAHPEYFQRFSWYFLPGREERLPAEVGKQIGEKFSAAQAVIERCLIAAFERGEIARREFRLAAAALYAHWVGTAYLRMLNAPGSGRGRRDHGRIRAESDAIFVRALVGSPRRGRNGP